MKPVIISITLILALNFTAYCQFLGPVFNLDFELNDNPKSLPNDWIQWGDFKLSSESKIVHSGNYSSVIESKDTDGKFGSIAYIIPSKYMGKEITLEGYMKIVNVKDGFGGLLLRLDGKSAPQGFDNMQNQALDGSIDWQKYSITLPFSEKVEKIIVGGILVGSGKAYFDNFTVLIDGKSIQGMPLLEKPKAKAELDTEFDEGSRIELGQLSEKIEHRLYILCKLWGFLKYHHPEIAKGNHNWDYELFRIMSKIKSEDFDDKLNDWVVSIGPISPPSKLEDDEDQVLQLVDYYWIKENKILTTQTKSLLTQIKNCTKPDDHYYISAHVGVGNPSFDNETSYKPMDYSDDGLRLLSLFRYWNMVEYYFPYKELMDEKWDDVLKTFIPKIVNKSDGLSYKLNTLELIGKLQDTHANLWMIDEEISKFHGVFGPPIKIKWIENKWVVTKILNAFDNPDSKISIGDIVTHVNGQAISELVPSRAKYCPASNLPTQMREVAKRILRTNETSIELSFNSTNGTYNEVVSTILNESINYWKTDTKSHKLLDGNIGYIYPAALKEDEIHDIMKTFAETQSLVIDLRCYPSDFLVFKLGTYLHSHSNEFAKFTKPIINEPGHYIFTPPSINGSLNVDYYKGKVFILINELTQSQAEYTTMALRTAPNATVIGSTTAGADGNISRIVLPGGIKTAFSGIGVYYPDGRETQRIGIIPDIKLKPTIVGIRQGKDELLELAIKMSKI